MHPLMSSLEYASFGVAYCLPMPVPFANKPFSVNLCSGWMEVQLAHVDSGQSLFEIYVALQNKPSEQSFCHKRPTQRQ